MWFILSLVAVFFWSGSDFFSKLGSPQKDKNSHLKMIVAVGLVMGSHATYQVLVNGVTFNLQTVLVYLPVSFLYIFSMLLGYIGLRYIELSITSPICNTSGAVAAFLSFKANAQLSATYCHRSGHCCDCSSFLFSKAEGRG